MLKFHTKISHWLVYCLFFVCFFGSLALFDHELANALRGELAPASRAQAFVQLAKKYPNDAVLSIKNLRDGGLETAHFNPKDPKRVKKASRELFGANGFEPYAATGFFKVLHFKFAPAHGWAKELGKAASSLVALGLLVAFITGLLVLKPRQLGRLSAPKQRGRLHLAHVNFGILAGVFLLWFCASGVGLNYLQTIDKALNPPQKAANKTSNFAKTPNIPKNQATSKQTKVAGKLKTSPAEPAAKKPAFERSDDELAVLAAQLYVIAEDAAKRLETEQLEILSIARKQWIVRPAAEFGFRTDGRANARQLVYQGERMVKFTADKPASGLASVYNLFVDFHRLHAAPAWLRLLVAGCGMLSCCFMIYALKLASLARAFNYLAMPFACIFSATVFFILERANLGSVAVWGFYAAFFASLFAARFASPAASLLGCLGCLALLNFIQGGYGIFSVFAAVCSLAMALVVWRARTMQPQSEAAR